MFHVSYDKIKQYMRRGRFEWFWLLVKPSLKLMKWGQSFWSFNCHLKFPSPAYIQGWMQLWFGPPSPVCECWDGHGQYGHQLDWQLAGGFSRGSGSDGYLILLSWTLSSGSSWWPWRSNLPSCPLLLYLEEIWLSSREVVAGVNERNFVSILLTVAFIHPWEVVMNVLKQGFFVQFFWLGTIGNWMHQMLSSTHWDQSSWSPHISSTGVDLNRFKFDPSGS